MEIKDVLDKKLVCILRSATKKESILELIALLDSQGKIHDVRGVRENIFHREKLMSTGIGLGIAVPHTRMEGVGRPVMAVGVAPSPIRDYESIDGENVRIIALIICGSKQHKEYISLLSSVVNKLKNKDLKESLFSAETPEKVFEILSCC